MSVCRVARCILNSIANLFRVNIELNRMHRSSGIPVECREQIELPFAQD